MSKLSITQAAKVIPVSESTLRRDLKSGKVSFDTDAKGRKQIDVSELTRVYGQLNAQNGSQPQEDPSGESAEPVKDDRQNVSMNGNDTAQNPSVNGNDSEKVLALLEGQVADLKAQLAQATDREKTLLDLADRLQKQNEVLMLPAPEKKRGWLDRLMGR